MSEAQRDDVWAELPKRLTRFSARTRLLPWIRDELVDWVRDSIVAQRGTWLVGEPGAAAEFPVRDDLSIDVRVEEGVVTAQRRDGAFRLRVNEKVRAFAFGDGAPIVLGLPKGRATIASASSFQALGPDNDAIAESDRARQLFDLGFGHQRSRFCIRTSDETLASALSNQNGRSWSDVALELRDQLISTSPHRIVETATARIEVFTGMPDFEKLSPNDAQTLFLPTFLEPGADIPDRLALPDYAAPIAVFYPDKT